MQNEEGNGQRRCGIYILGMEVEGTGDVVFSMTGSRFETTVILKNDSKCKYCMGRRHRNASLHNTGGCIIDALRIHE